MNSMRLVFRDASRQVLDAVLIACSQERDNVCVNLSDGAKWAPQVHLSGSHKGEAIYHIETPNFPIDAALRISMAANTAAVPVPAI